MKWILSVLILSYSGFAQAGGRIPFLFMPRVPDAPAAPPPELSWNVTYMTFNGFGGAGSTQTATLTNNSGAMSNVITVSITTLNGNSFQIQNDTCTGGFLLNGGSCTVDIHFNGLTVPDEQLTATDGVYTTPPMTVHNCPGC